MEGGAAAAPEDGGHWGGLCVSGARVLSCTPSTRNSESGRPQPRFLTRGPTRPCALTASAPQASPEVRAKRSFRARRAGSVAPFEPKLTGGDLGGVFPL